MKNICLINIVSDQNIINFIPVIVLKPTKVINIITNNSLAQNRNNLESAIRMHCGENCVCQRENTSSENPSLSEMKTTVENLLREHKDSCICYVNISGGTKPMSYGAVLGTMNEPPASGAIIYVEDSKIDYLQTFGNDIENVSERFFEDELDNIPNLLNLIVLANDGSMLGEGKNWKPYRLLAELIHNYYCSNKKYLEPKKGDVGCMEFLAKLYIERPEIVEAMCAVGIAQEYGSGQYRSLNGTFNKGTDDVEQFFLGTWWEIHIVNKLAKSGFFREIRWSSNVNNMEEDIIALPYGSIVPFIFSMKRSFSNERLLPRLYEFAGRANSIGGLASKKILCIFNYFAGKNLKEIFETSAEKQCIKIMTRYDSNKLKDPDFILSI